MEEKKYTIVIKTVFGLEEVLAQEIKELGFSEVKVLNRAVTTTGSIKDVYRLNLELRCAISVLIELKRFRIRSADDLYDQAAKIKWVDMFSIEKTFAVKGAINSNIFINTQLPLLIVKDAIVDQFRDKYDDRPNVETKTADVVLNIYINQTDCVLSFNTSGSPLYQRGYRSEVGEAPINEVLAAGMIKLSGWDKQMPILDPFCGSGTIAIEAALMATNTPAMIDRKSFAFQHLLDYDSTIWDSVHDSAIKKIKPLETEIYASDLSVEMVQKAKSNASVFPFGDKIHFKTASFEENNSLGEKGITITNPPYGERLSINEEELYGDIGTWMKQELQGWDCWIITSSENGLKSIGLRPSRRIKLFNGDLECSFRKFEMYRGSKKGKYIEKYGLETENTDLSEN